MTIEMQYNLASVVSHIVINKNQTLLAVKVRRSNDKIEIYSMETGIHISKYG